jgi:hypothetical protein
LKARKIEFFSLENEAGSTRSALEAIPPVESESRRVEVGDSAWEWSFHFNAHWGAHVVGALGALHAWRGEGGGEVDRG